MLSQKIEWEDSTSLQNWVVCGVCHTERQYQDWQSPLAKFVFEKKRTNKKKKKRKINWGYMWGGHSSKTRPSLVKPPCNASRETKDCRVVQSENWVSQLNIRTELGLYLELPHPKTMSELRKAPCIKATAKKKKIKLFSHKKQHIWCFEVSSFNFKDNFIIAREPLVCGNIFYNCPIVSIVQTAWMANCGHQKVVVQKRNFVVVSASDWKKVFRKALVIHHKSAWDGSPRQEQIE